MGYKTTRHVDFDGKAYPAGRAIAFPDTDAGAAAREQLLALVPPAIEGDAAKPLEKMNKAELEAVIADEDVTVPDGHTTNSQLVEAIKAHRAASAG